MTFQIVKRYIRRFISIPLEDDEATIYEEIVEGAHFKGYNLWVLGFAMVIASIGLTTDSMSAIIGAMLISPLMGPIVGMSFGMAINDLILKKNSFKNWFLMTGVSLLAATLFFLINPFNDDTNLLKSFERASIFDILLAFLGGLAGFIGIIKKEGTKIIAGVAVATACMPPLCTASYGIAHLNYEYFIGGLYFYLINCLFIGLATFLLTRYFKFNRNIIISTLEIWLWNILIFIMLIPGVYIAHTRYQERKQVIKKEPIEIKVQRLEDRLNVLDSLYHQK